MHVPYCDSDIIAILLFTDTVRTSHGWSSLKKSNVNMSFSLGIESLCRRGVKRKKAFDVFALGDIVGLPLRVHSTATREARLLISGSRQTEPSRARTARAAHAPPTYARSVRVRLLSARSLHISRTTTTAHTMSAMPQAEVPAGGVRAKLVDLHAAHRPPHASPFLSPLCLGSPRAGRQSDSESGANNAAPASDGACTATQ